MMVKVAVLGSGLLGTKIAGCFAYHGHRVKVYDENTGVLDAFTDNLESDKQEIRAEGLMSQPNFLGQVLCMSRLEETVEDAEFIFEAIVENLQIKQDLFEKVSHLCHPTTIIATNTLNLDVESITDRSAYPERCMGLRFLHPVYAIPEVEISPTRHTSQQNIEKVRIMLERMSKTLFFRSGREPLILSDAQISSRKLARKEQIARQHGMLVVHPSDVPELGHSGNISPSLDDDCVTVSDRDCAICMDRPRDCLLCPCHHLVTCHECAKSLVNRKDFCPICRKEITETIRVHIS